MIAALTTAMLLLAGPAPGASATTAEIPRRVCDVDWSRGTWHVRQLIRCAARRWDSPGGGAKAIAVAECESHLRPHAYNPRGYAGLFQQSTRYWASRAQRWGQPHRSVYNGRANVIVSIRMAASTTAWRDLAGCA